MTKILGCGVLACAFACGSGAPRKSLGTVSMALTATNGTTTYRLTGATFDIAGATAMSVTPPPGDALFKVELPAGDYTITLQDGWTLQSSVDGGDFADVKAVLAGPATQSFTIFDQETTYVKYSFRAGPDVLSFGDGRLTIEIVVNEGSDGNCQVNAPACSLGSVTCSGHTATIANTCSFSSGAGQTTITCNGAGVTLPSGFGVEPNGYGNALRRLSELQGKMLAFFESHGTFPVGTAAATPAATCCAAGGVFQCPANPDAWHGIAVWDALGFSIDTAHSFVYSYVNATGDDAQIVAEGDLDCDTLNIDYGLHCHALNGNPTCSVTFPMPCPGQDYE